jgi:hypothetical protein
MMRSRKSSLTTLLFKHPFHGDGMGEDAAVEEPPKTLVELFVFQLSAAIREKPDWETKVHDDKIVSKWEKEALANTNDNVMTPEAFQYVIDLCRYLAQLKKDGDPIEQSVYSHIYQSDSIIPQDLRDKFASQMNAFENSILSEEEKDYHPGTNKQVLDLVHPSLYCLVKGVTKSATDSASLFLVPPFKFDQRCGKGNVIEDFDGEGSYQWIPTDVDVRVTTAADSENGTPNVNVKFQSYINNLHPDDHKDGLYKTLEEILSCVVPMFDRVLQGIQVRNSDTENNSAINVNVNVNTPLELKIIEPNYQIEYPECYALDDEEIDRFYETRVPASPVVLPFVAPPAPPLSTMAVLSDECTLQVIIKMASIELSPASSPTYNGGTWHIEGMDNEQIVATGIYYYDCVNITPSKLSFRAAVEEPVYEQDDRRGVKEIYGLEHDQPLNQMLGSFSVEKHRCLVFPNLYQHRVDPFELLDPTQPGRRKILVFFLVDPSRRIPSTSDIPPQQLDWWKRCHPFGGGDGEQHFKNSNSNPLLPDDLVDKIVQSYCDYPISPDTAKEFRLRLMEERTFQKGRLDNEKYERPFSLCEH